MSVEYRGITFPGYNKPIKSNRPGKKKMVLAKKGETIRLIHFGATGYGHNYSAAARKSFRARHKCDTASVVPCGVGQVNQNSLAPKQGKESTNGRTIIYYGSRNFISCC